MEGSKVVVSLLIIGLVASLTQAYDNEANGAAYNLADNSEEQAWKQSNENDAYGLAYSLADNNEEQAWKQSNENEAAYRPG